MPENRRHRGAHPRDAQEFAAEHWPALRAAVGDLSWLMSRDYAEPSAVKIVGDRYQLTARQRLTVLRCACSDAALDRRQAHEIAPESLAGEAVAIDGFNLITTVEAALAGGVLLLARDGCVRDMASMHGNYRKVEETLPAIHASGETLGSLGVTRVTWYLDSPVSNSGRLKVLLVEHAAAHGLPWDVCVVQNPDAELAASSEVVATADSVILDRCGRWTNLARRIIERCRAPVIDMRPEVDPGAPRH